MAQNKHKDTEETKNVSSIKSECGNASNVQLVFLTETPKEIGQILNQDEVEANIDSKDQSKLLSIDELTKNEALQFQQEMLDYQACSPHYKDGKALGIVDRLANNILAEMIIDFQRDEMDQIVRALYNLEFN